MKSRDQVWVLYGHSMHLNHSKMIKITSGKLSEMSQLTTHHSNKVIATEWCQSSNRGFDRVRKKPATKSRPVHFIPQENLKVYCTSNPFLVKS